MVTRREWGSGEGGKGEGVRKHELPATPAATGDKASDAVETV